MNTLKTEKDRVIDLNDDDFNELRRLAINVLKNKNGERFLNLLEKIYILKTPVAPHYQSESYAYFREGENMMIRKMRGLITIENK